MPVFCLCAFACRVQALFCRVVLLCLSVFRFCLPCPAAPLRRVGRLCLRVALAFRCRRLLLPRILARPGPLCLVCLIRRTSCVWCTPHCRFALPSVPTCPVLSDGGFSRLVSSGPFYLRFPRPPYCMLLRFPHLLCRAGPVASYPPPGPLPLPDRLFPPPRPRGAARAGPLALPVLH